MWEYQPRYYLYDKNGKSFYIFRRSQGEWELAYGVLAYDILEACIDALIRRLITIRQSYSTPMANAMLSVSA